MNDAMSPARIFVAGTRGAAGIYNMAEPDGIVCIDRAVRPLGWQRCFRLAGA